MGLGLLIVMIGVPIAEIAVFIEAGDTIGFWPTLGIIMINGHDRELLSSLSGPWRHFPGFSVCAV